jgi:hypothetical protein
MNISLLYAESAAPQEGGTNFLISDKGKCHRGSPERDGGMVKVVTNMQRH